MSDLQKLVRHQLQLGNDRLEAFNNVLSTANIDSYTFPTENYSFDDLLTADDLTDQQAQLRDLVQAEFEKAEPFSEARKCQAKECKMRMLSDRYAVDAQEKDGKFQSFVLFDLFHDQRQ